MRPQWRVRDAAHCGSSCRSARGGPRNAPSGNHGERADLRWKRVRPYRAQASRLSGAQVAAEPERGSRRDPDVPAVEEREAQWRTHAAMSTQLRKRGTAAPRAEPPRVVSLGRRMGSRQWTERGGVQRCDAAETRRRSAHRHSSRSSSSSTGRRRRGRARSRP